jgi:hypothetical protein
VTSDYYVNNGSLTLEAGAVLAFREGTSLSIGYNDSAKLIVRGTAAEPVLFTSADDRVPGVWRGVRLESHADRSSVEHLVVELAGADRDEAVYIEAEGVVWVSSTVRDVKGVGIGFGRHGSVERFEGNRFERVGRWPLSIGPAAAGGLVKPSVFDEGAVIHVYGGTIVGPVTWRPAGAPYYVSEDVHVEGEKGERSSLTLAAGVEARFGPEARLAVGYSQRAAVLAFGTPEAPVRLVAAARSWPGVVVYGTGEASFTGVELEGGGSAESPGVLRVEGELSLASSRFRGNVGGVTLGARARVRAFDENGFEGNTKAAVQLHPHQLGELGGANRYAEGERLELVGGRLEESATWRAQGAVVEVLGDVDIDGRTVLTIEAGARFAVKDRVTFRVGTRDNAGVRMAGKVDSPIEWRGLRDEPGAWGGILLDGSSRDSLLEHVRLRNAAGVTVAADANAVIFGLSCDRCSGPPLSVECGVTAVWTDINADGHPATVVQKPCD